MGPGNPEEISRFSSRLQEVKRSLRNADLRQMLTVGVTTCGELTKC